MPVPFEYQRATEEFYQFLMEVKEVSGLTTSNQTYTMVQGVFQTFRRRISIEQAIQFANLLPALLRALFVTDWDVNQKLLPFADRATLTKEVQNLRLDHNFAPDTAIRDVALVLRKTIDEKKLEIFLSRLSPGAMEYWQV
jgi:uncharacterized protein (DUF2267 family)